MDSFRPGGTYYYRPFYKGFRVHRGNNSGDENNNNSNDNNDNNNSNDSNNSSISSNVVRNQEGVNEAPNQNDSSDENNSRSRQNFGQIRPENLISGTGSVATEDARRRLYLDLARPRPFYGRAGNPERPVSSFLEVDVQVDVRHSDPKSLQVS